MSKRRVGVLVAVLTAIAVVHQPISAIANDAAASKHPKPPRPQVKGSWLKEAGRLTAETKTTSRNHRPGKKTTGDRQGGHSTHRPVAHRPETRSEVQMHTSALIESRLNEGICSRLPDGTIQGPSRCQDYFDTQRPPQPTVEQSIDLVRQRIQQQSIDIPFPKLTVKVQPAGRTLVNLDTIVYTDKQKATTLTVRMLGYPVTVVGRPVSYTWHFGDGTPDVTTQTPGSPYPAKEITHKYLHRGDVELSVTVNYSATFDLAGSGPQAIPGTLPVTGPTTALQVREAVPVLVDPPG